MLGGRRRALAVLVAMLAAVLAAPLASARGDEPPGTVIGAHPLPADQWPPGAGAAQLVDYWSTGAGGAATPVSGVVYVPVGQAPPGGWPVLSWAHGTTGLGDSCAPYTVGGTDSRSGYLANWLAQGFAVVATNYAGLGTPGVHPYLDGWTEGYGVTDMVRAGRAVLPSLSERWFVAGQSQGGHAALFTANLATRYAPELDFRGAVAHGVPAKLAGLVSAIGPEFPPSLLGPEMKTYLTYFLAGLRAARPDFGLASYLTPLGQSVVNDAEVLCSGDMEKRMENIKIGEMFTKQLGEPFRQAWESIYTVPTTGYDRPLFIAQGEKDTTANPSLTNRLVSDLAANAQPYTYRTYPTGHVDTPEAALPDATAFARGLFASH